MNSILCKMFGFIYLQTGWSNLSEDKGTKYRLTIKDIQQQESGTYTCASPRGLTNSIVIVVTSNLSSLFSPLPTTRNIRFYGSSRTVLVIHRTCEPRKHQQYWVRVIKGFAECGVCRRSCTRATHSMCIRTKTHFIENVKWLLVLHDFVVLLFLRIRFF